MHLNIKHPNSHHKKLLVKPFYYNYKVYLSLDRNRCFNFIIQNLGQKGNSSKKCFLLSVFKK